MNLELLEHQLHELDNNNVTIVRQFFGTQSESRCGALQIMSGSQDHTFKYHFNSSAYALIFELNDVISINPTKKIIYLKGPESYVSQEATH